MISKRILTMQDISCVGQCSLTVALPVLSAYGLETCVLPTALLSNHTAYDRWSFLDLTGETQRIMNVWRDNGFQFDAFLLGYLGDASLVEAAQTCFQDFSGGKAPIIIDPAFGDNGKLYPPFDDRYVDAMRELIRSANILLPNLTEACFLTATEYPEKVSEKLIKDVIRKLAKLTSATIVLTGAEKENKIGEWIYNGESFTDVWKEKLPGHFHGTGDLFASVFTAIYLKTGNHTKACEEAGKFVADSIQATDPSHRYGVNFEAVLYDRIKRSAPTKP